MNWIYSVTVGRSTEKENKTMVLLQMVLPTRSIRGEQFEVQLVWFRGIANDRIRRLHLLC